MIRFAFAFVLLCLPTLARADTISCELPWFIRNLMFDRAGYCFSSPLGRALFDNSDCTGSDRLSPRDAAAVAQIRALERGMGCHIDTNGWRLEHQDTLAYLRGVRLLPVPVADESGCIGYLGPDLPLLAAPAGKGPILGVLPTGADIAFGFRDEGQWAFVTVFGAGWRQVQPGLPAGQGRHGWVHFPGGSYPSCRQYAG
ncbi:DUF4453 domain-containing protein [Nioella nitratireducens]|uniref:DUF4453 domain-containing protein n=1 Tax=Nioella nitratireducens TaxID=1287720 RepID=UPI0008FD2F10|nr:DUF4453 domain-containing protein [Nioella nitratireducens]